MWESHFFDHLALLAVDHPDTTEIFVDESFVFPPPDSTIYHTSNLRPVTAARDLTGRNVLSQVSDRDEKYFEGVPLGQYQGIAEEHFIEFEIQDHPRNDMLLAYGWVRPTDSSINVAIGQGGNLKPEGVHLEAKVNGGSWVSLKADLGFPSGKHKTMLIPWDRNWTSAYSVFRLRTNMEIYWDQLATVSRYSLESVTTKRQIVEKVDLIYRGFSEVTEKDRFSPELPNYAKLAATEPIWRDLEGFYTRFGDVSELIQRVDDRYVIMNAGDEMRISFRADKRSENMKRDFVLIGDGWVKDGDFNTVASKTLGPLPTHSNSSYTKSYVDLFEDPIYKKYKADWTTYHTRFVSTDRFSTNLVPIQDK